ncbi:MAG: hypothetical protein NTU78_16540 [Alphaproteobacteria bacterium]|nr:hypothetical protein [Alphaproteobacteria bacterium]
MDVVLVAVVGGTDGDDGLQCRGLACGHLQRVEAAPGDAEHAHLAGAPALPGDPGDDLQRVILLLLGIFVFHQPVAVAIAAHVDPDRRIAMAG